MQSKLAIEAAQLIERLDRLVRSGESGHGLNPAQWEALRYLARANRFSRNPAALADYLGSTRGTVSQTLIALEQKGHVARTSWALHAGTRTLRVEVDIPNAEGRLRPGMYATVDLLVARRENALSLPASAASM